MGRPTKFVIDNKALEYNISLAKKLAGNSRVMGVVKADAYGHGVGRTMQSLHKLDALALLELEKALELRASGYKKPILLLEGYFDEKQLEIFSEASLYAVIHNTEQVNMLLSSVVKKPIGIFLKLNSGMNRLGFPPEQFKKKFVSLAESGKVKEIVAMTHYADADGKHGIDWQYRVFSEVIDGIKDNVKTSLGNSAALLSYPNKVGDWVRPGIMLYGASGLPEPNHCLKPVMSLKSEVISRQSIKKGESVGYGCDFIADRDMKIGIVACGYGDGYPRNIRSNTPVMVGNKEATIVGRVSMDLLAIDLTNFSPEEQIEEVTLWGDTLPVEKIADAAGTISYDLLVRASKRVRFVSCG